MKKVILFVIGGLIALTSLIGLESVKADGYTANCETSAVVQCGVYSQSNLDSRIRSDARDLYSSLGTGTSLSAAKYGVVYPDGTVKVDGVTVATGAMTFGRIKRNASDATISAGDTTFYKHSITGAAINKPVDAHVFLDGNGQFTGAIIQMCGNPVVANPVPKPTPPPAPTPTPKAYCKDLTVTPITRTKFNFEAESRISDGATINGYGFTVKKDGVVVDNFTVNSTNTSISHEYTAEESGSYTATLTVKTSVGDRTDSNCKASFTVGEAPVAVCSGLTATITNRTNYRLDAEASADNSATISGYLYTITRDDDDKIILHKLVSSTEETSSTEGTLPAGAYTAQVIVKTSEGDKTNEDCKAPFTIAREEAKPIKVCEIDTKKIITIDKKDFDTDKHTKDLSVCDEVVPVTPELPQTGIGEQLTGFVGMGSMVAGSGYYIASRRSVLNAWFKR